MAIFDRAFRNSAADDHARQVLSLTTPEDWRRGGSVSVGGEAALKLSAVYGCVESIAKSMSKLPVFVMDTKTKEHIKDHPLMPLLTKRPNEAMTPSVYKIVMHRSRLLKGNGCAAIIREKRSARPVELLPLPWDYTQTVIVGGNLWYVYIDPKTGKKWKLPSDDIIHYKINSDDGIDGKSVLSYAAQTIATGLEMQGYNLAFFQNNAQPAGILKTDGKLEKPAKDKIRDEWKSIHAGADNSFKIAVLDFGLEYKPIAIDNKDSQFIQNKAVNVEDIARFFGVPLYKLMTGKQAYNSNEQNGIDYVVNTIHPIVTPCEEEDTYKLLMASEINKGIEIRQNMMAELRGDIKSRAEWYKTMREIGYFSVDDICDLEDTPKVPGGHTRNASLNYVPLEQFEELSVSRNKKGGAN